MITTDIDFLRKNSKKRTNCLMCLSSDINEFLQKKISYMSLDGGLSSCGNCGFVFSSDYFTPDAAEKFYEIKYKEGNYKSYCDFGEMKKEIYRTLLEGILRQIKINIPTFNSKNCKMLDLGCGEGFSTHEGSKLGLKTTGVDISATAISIAVRKYGSMFFSSPLEKIDCLNLPKDFDLITLFDVLDHVYAPSKVIELASIHIKKNGFLYIDVCNFNSPYRYIMGKSYAHIIPYEHLSYFSKKTIKRLLEKNEFKIIYLKNNPRKINFNYLTMTLKTFNPILAKIFSYIGELIPDKLKEKNISIPSGLISILAQKK